MAISGSDVIQFKNCKDCNSQKPIEDFQTKGYRNGRLRRVSYCRICWNQRVRQYHKKNRKHIYSLIKVKDDNKREYIDSIRTNNPCIDCGQKYHFSAMEFDHVPGRGKKEFEIGLFRAHTLEDIKTEMTKCDLVCRNCHAVRTFNRKYGVT